MTRYSTDACSFGIRSRGDQPLDLTAQEYLVYLDSTIWRDRLRLKPVLCDDRRELLQERRVVRRECDHALAVDQDDRRESRHPVSLDRRPVGVQVPGVDPGGEGDPLQ